MNEQIYKKYQELCVTRSDIWEHLPVLYKYALECSSIFETGVRGCVSSWALLYGLLNSASTSKKRLLLNDIDACNIQYLKECCDQTEVELSYVWENNLSLVFKPDETFDLTFIDTFHCCGQIRRELEKFSQVTNKYIIMHDTTVDEYAGEPVRARLCINTLMNRTGFSQEELMLGMSQGITIFLTNHPEWKVKEKLTNCNGLTILEKIVI
jgi:hypothetical protein